MVRALLDGSKTQTRRAAKLTEAGHVKEPGGHRRWHPTDKQAVLACPYGQPGDSLWVRESWRIGAWNDAGGTLAVDYLASTPSKTPWVTVPEDSEDYHGGSVFERYWQQSTDDCIKAGIAANSDDKYQWNAGQSPCRTRPSIHMPRWASRITLEITGVRLERLQDISRGDAMAEGCPFPNMAKGDDPRKWYADLWEQINGPGSWNANPIVWVVEFKRVET